MTDRDKIQYVEKVILSCKTHEQLVVANTWAMKFYKNDAWRTLRMEKITHIALDRINRIWESYR